MLKQLESLEINFVIKSPDEQVCLEKTENFSLIGKYKR